MWVATAQTSTLAQGGGTRSASPPPAKLDSTPPNRQKLVVARELVEDSLISNEPRAVTVLAAEACDLIVFDREAMRQCMTHHPSVAPILLRFLRGRVVEQLPRTSPLFASFDTAQGRVLSGRLEFIAIAAGEQLIQQGKPSPGCSSY